MWAVDRKKVSLKENLGRRVFLAKPYSDEAKRLLKLSIFLDDRLEEDLSLDRLGVRQPDIAPVTAKLTPLAIAAGAKMAPAQPFKGWAAFKMSELRPLSVRADPNPPEEPTNEFHALLDRTDFRNEAQANTLAHRLRSHVYALVEPSAAVSTNDGLQDSGIKRASAAILNWVMQKLRLK